LCPRAESPALPLGRVGEIAAPALLVGALGLLYWLLAPGTVDGDGIGYIRQAEHGGGLAPGHLAYIPVLRWLARLYPHQTSLELVPLFRGLSVLCAVAALALFYDSARLVHGARRALLATALLGTCHAFSRSASEIETYAPAILCVTATLWALLRSTRGDAVRWPWVAAVGLFGAAAALFHLTLGLLDLSALVILGWWSPARRRLRAVLLAATTMATISGAVVLLALRSEGHTTIGAAWSWLRSADHGLPYPHTIFTPLVTLWGFVRTLIYAPYPYEAPVIRVAALTTVGAAAWIALVMLRRRSSALPSRASGRFLALWVAPLALFALTFFPSDTERWIFAVPAVALYLAPAAGRAMAALIVAVLVVNLAVYQIPTARDRDAIRIAAAVDRHVAPTDLVVFAGHSWDELIGMSVSRPPRRFCFIYYVGAERVTSRPIPGPLHPQVAGATRRMHQEIDDVLRSGGRAFVARLRDDRDAQGFKEMTWFGLSRDGFAALFVPYAPRPTTIDGLWQLSPRSLTSPPR
jgi:hypothetical protein